MSFNHSGMVFKTVDKYGQERVIRGSRHGLKLQRQSSTLCIDLSNVIGPLIGRNIRLAREEAKMTLAELCERAGLVSVSPKSRMWEIETGVRKNGIRFGTLYAIAMALGKDPADFLPSMKEVMELMPLKFEKREVLAAKS